MARLVIAVLGQNAATDLGGEALLPVQFFRAYRRLGHRAVLFCHERNRENLRAALSAEEFADVFFERDTVLQRVSYALQRRAPGGLAHVFELAVRASTERRQARRLRDLAGRERIDFVHHVTPVSPRAVTFIADVGPPVFHGPLNGNMSFPPAFQHRSPISAGAERRMRGALEAAHHLFTARRRSAGIFVCNERTRAALPRACRGAPCASTVTDNGILPEVWQRNPVTPPRDRARFVFVGRLVEVKAVDLLIEAFARVEAPAELLVVGNGPLRGALERQAAATGADIRFVGARDHTGIAEILAASTALVMPSLRESGGAVCAEAMATGVPVIGTDWGGIPDYVDASTGILVPPTGHAAFVAGFAEAMDRLARDPALQARLATAARAKASREFTWDRRAAFLLDCMRRWTGPCAGGVAEEDGSGFDAPPDPHAVMARPG